MTSGARRTGFIFIIFLGLSSCRGAPTDKKIPAQNPGPVRQATPAKFAAPPAAPAVILVIIDTLPAGHVSAYGYERMTTPNLDQLAKDGVRFERAIAASPWTLPSVASIMTGVIPYRHRAGMHLDPWTMDNRRLSLMDPSRTTLAELLKQNDYQTVGFFNCPFVHPGYGLDQGFDDYDYNGGDNLIIRRAPEVVDKAIAWINQNGGKPFFMTVHFFDPHLAYDPLPDLARTYLEEYKGELSIPFNPDIFSIRKGETVLSDEDKKFVVGLYDAEVNGVDRELGRFIAHLKAKGLYDAAVIVVTADHGEEFWEHRGFEHGHSLHREVIEIPLVIKLPGQRRAGDTVKEFASQVDIFPSLASLLSLTPPADLDGVNLFPTGDLGAGPRSIYAMNVHYGPEQQAIYDSGCKLIVNTETGKIQVYKLNQDPTETTNIFGQGRLPKALHDQVEKIAQDLEAAYQNPGQEPELDRETRLNLENLGYFNKSYEVEEKNLEPGEEKSKTSDEINIIDCSSVGD